MNDPNTPLIIAYVLHVILAIVGIYLAFSYYERRKYIGVGCGLVLFVWNISWLVARLILKSPYLMGGN